jgi:tetratricopeptide (TPR) repeat protein
MADANQLYDEAEKLKDAGDYAGAAAKMEEILKGDENHVLAHLGLSVVYGKLSRYEDAVHHARRACELEPADRLNWTAMSVTCQRAWAGTQNPRYIQLAEEAKARAAMV